MQKDFCIYLRKSRADMDLEQKGEGETLARHEATLLELAKRQNIAVTTIHREIVSGENLAARPIMQQLLNEVENNSWAGVLVMDIDRLARGDSIDQGIIAQAFKYSGTKIITPMKTYNPDNEFDEEFFEFGLFMSRREYKMINRRLQRGRLVSVHEGKYVGSGQPYGYSKVKLEKEKGYTLVPVEEQAAIVRLMFEWYVNGHEGVRIGPTAIANKLTAMGVAPLKKDFWKPATVRDILRNPVYIGKIRWNWRAVEKRIEGGQRISARPRNDSYELVEGLHPAIVDEELWQRAQLLATQNSIPKTQRERDIQNPLSGLIVCGVCGSRMVRKPYKGNAKDSILCVTPKCKNVSSLLEAVENQLLHSLQQWLRKYRVMLENRPASIPNTKTTVLKHLYKNLEDAEKQKSKAHDLLELDVYDIDTFLTRTKEIAKHIEELQASITETELSLKLDIKREKQRANILPSVACVLDNYNKAQTPAEKNALLKAVIEKAVYRREKGGRWSHEGFELHIFPKIDT